MLKTYLKLALMQGCGDLILLWLPEKKLEGYITLETGHKAQREEHHQREEVLVCSHFQIK